MATFAILTGKKIASAIASFGKVAATFSQRTHQIAYSALNHVELHHDACYVQALYEATPVNYRKAIADWATYHGKVAFDAKTLTFTYAKRKASKMDEALQVSPADFTKANKGPKASTETALIDKTEKAFNKVLADPKARKADKAFARTMLAHIETYRGPESAQAADNVVELKTRKPRPSRKGMKPAGRKEKAAVAA